MYPPNPGSTPSELLLTLTMFKHELGAYPKLKGVLLTCDREDNKGVKSIQAGRLHFHGATTTLLVDNPLSSTKLFIWVAQIESILMRLENIVSKNIKQ